MSLSKVNLSFRASYTDKEGRFKISFYKAKSKSYKRLDYDEVCFIHKPYYLDIYSGIFWIKIGFQINPNGNNIITIKDKRLVEDLKIKFKQLYYNNNIKTIYCNLYE